MEWRKIGTFYTSDDGRFDLAKDLRGWWRLFDNKEMDAKYYTIRTMAMAKDLAEQIVERDGQETQL